MQATRNIAETGVNFNYSPIVCDIYKINKGIKQPILIEPGKTEIMGWLQLVSTDLVGLVTPVARGNYRFVVKCSEYYTKFKVVYQVLYFDEGQGADGSVKFVQDIVMPVGLHLLHLRADCVGKFIVDYYDDYCKNTAVIQQFLSPHIPEQNRLSERDERTVIDVAR